MPVVLVPPARLQRWVDNTVARHGAVDLAVADAALRGVCADGSVFDVRLPFDRPYEGPATLAGLVDAVVVPSAWGVLLVRRGGFAVGYVEGARLVRSKVGQRYVQGRTKAGGQSQQRFARRRDNQARAAFEAAAEHAAIVLDGAHDARHRLPVVVGGDRPAVADVLGDARLAHLQVVGHWFATPDPRRAVLDDVAERAAYLVVDVRNADEAPVDDVRADG